MSESRELRLPTHVATCQTGGAGERHFLCMHGLVDSFEIWSRIGPQLEERGSVCRFDQRGHGGSQAPEGPYAREDLARDVVAILDSLDVEKSILVGNSMGGIVAMETALLFPERIAGLVLIGTTSQCRSKVADWYETIAQQGEREGCPGLARAIYGKRSQKEIAGDAQGIAHVTRMLKSLHSAPLTDRLEKLECPTLVLVGEKDPMGPKASEIIRDALSPDVVTFKMIPERGHWLHIDSHEVVVDTIDLWLTERDL